MKKLAQKLEKQRKALGMTYKIVSERSGVPVWTVRRIMRGMDCKLRNLRRIAESMGLELVVRFDGGPWNKVKCD